MNSIGRFLSYWQSWALLVDFVKAPLSPRAVKGLMVLELRVEGLRPNKPRLLVSLVMERMPGSQGGLKAVRRISPNFDCPKP